MPESSTTQVSPAVLADHAAVRAWDRLHPGQVNPQRIETLGLNRQTAVYRLQGAGGDGGAVVAKRCRARIAEVERLIYEEVLPRAGVTALRYFGWLREPGGEYCWLFLEDAGRAAYSPASDQHRALAGRWLAALHQLTLNRELRTRLPQRSASHYLGVIRASRKMLQERVEHPAMATHGAALLQGFVERLDLMQSRWQEVQKFFDAWPASVVHGDLAVKNLRVRAGATGPEFLAFDWEMAGWGVPAVDLAQCLGKTASPDLETYAAIRKGCSARLRSADVERLAAYGNLCRLLDAIFWEAVSLRGPTHECLVGPLMKLNCYEPRLAAALRAVRWSAYV